MCKNDCVLQPRLLGDLFIGLEDKYNCQKWGPNNDN